MKRRIVLLSAASALLLTACGSKFKRYNDPQVTRVIVFKGERKMHLMHKGKALRSYDIDLGFAPYQHKHENANFNLIIVI